MQESVDLIYEFLEYEKAACIRKRKLAADEWDSEKAHYWQGHLDGLVAAADRIRPLTSQTMLDFEASDGEYVAQQANGSGPTAETENVLPELESSYGNPAEGGHRVLVARTPLMDALKRMTRFRKRAARREMMSVSFRKGLLTLTMMNVSEGIPAEGVWANDVLVNSGILYNLAKVPPIEDPVLVKVEQDRLYIGSAATPLQLG